MDNDTKRITEDDVIELVPTWFYEDVIRIILGPEYEYKHRYEHILNGDFKTDHTDIKNKEIEKYYQKYSKESLPPLYHKTMNLKNLTEGIYNNLCKSVTMFLYMLEDLEIVKEGYEFSKNSYNKNQRVLRC